LISIFGNHLPVAAPAAPPRATTDPEELDRALQALADPVRRAVIERLLREPCRSSELAAALCQSRPAMSRHLGVLRRAGLVRESLDGSPGSDARVRIYELRREAFTRVRRWLEQVETSCKE
jgi:DNA-binding transcriptional ArsR family regulator